MESDLQKTKSTTPKTERRYSPEIKSKSICGYCAHSIPVNSEGIRFVDSDKAGEQQLGDLSFQYFNGESLLGDIDILSKVRYAKHVVYPDKKEVFCHCCGATYSNCVMIRILLVNYLVYI